MANKDLIPALLCYLVGPDGQDPQEKQDYRMTLLTTNVR